MTAGVQGEDPFERVSEDEARDMTEEQAKERWCPFARVLTMPSSKVGRASYNRDGGRPQESLCIGSACMAWRWSETPKIGTKQLMRTDSMGYVNVPHVEREGGGYCGLAGTQP